MKVHYPHGGVHYLLRCWTNHEQNQIVLARSNKAAQFVAFKLIEQNEDLQLEEFLKIDVVAPSDKLSRYVDEQDYADNVLDFIRTITISLKFSFLDRGLSLPSLFYECKKYETKYGNFDKSSELEHYSCINCENGIRFDMTPNQLYDKYHEAWEDKFRYRGLTGCVSKASKAQDDEIIWAACPDFGHHRNGIELIRLKELKHIHPLFFFRKLAAMCKDDIRAAIKAGRDARTKIMKERVRIDEERRRQEDEEEIRKINEIFK